MPFQFLREDNRHRIGTVASIKLWCEIAFIACDFDYSLWVAHARGRGS